VTDLDGRFLSSTVLLSGLVEAVPDRTLEEQARELAAAVRRAFAPARFLVRLSA
jgi:hypothetical protein